jgi:molybdate transport system substrate-binding protein
LRRIVTSARSAVVTRSALVAIFGLVVLAVAGCSGPAPRGAQPRGASAVAAGSVTVVADAALVKVLTRVAGDFERAHPGTDVSVTAGSAADLAGRDVLVTADKGAMDAAAGSVTGRPLAFARTQLVIAVAAGNPKKIGDLSDLGGAKLRVVLCAATASCGTAAVTVLSAAGVALPKATRVPDVAAALTRIKDGTADAALVYRTDTRALAAAADVADAIDTVEFPGSAAAVGECHAAVAAHAANPVAAASFVGFLTVPAAQDRLTAAGFRLP